MEENLKEQSFFCQVVRHCRHPIKVQLHGGYQCLLQFFLRCLKHIVSFVVKCLGFCFSKTPYDSICQNFKTMFLGSNSLENAFMLRHYQHSDLPQKVTQPSFDLGAIGSFSFPTPMSIYIKHKFIDSRQHRNVTNYMNITNAYICQLTIQMLYLFRWQLQRVNNPCIFYFKYCNIQV